MSEPIISPLKKTVYTEADIISGICNNQDWAINVVYKTQYISIKNMVYSFRNKMLEPDDIFQEGLTRTILNIRADKFRGESSLATYLNSVCRNICLNLLARPNPMPRNEDLVSDESDNDNYYELLAFINKIKERLGNSCREIIDLRFKQSEGVTTTNDNNNKLHGFDEISQKLDITVDNARQRFKRCLDQLRKLVFDHPEYQTLFD